MREIKSRSFDKTEIYRSSWLPDDPRRTGRIERRGRGKNMKNSVYSTEFSFPFLEMGGQALLQ